MSDRPTQPADTRSKAPYRGRRWGVTPRRGERLGRSTRMQDALSLLATLLLPRRAPGDAVLGDEAVQGVTVDAEQMAGLDE